MEPIYQLQLAPGEKTIPGSKLPLGQLVVKWSIDHPDPNQQPSGLILVRQPISGVGFLELDQWQLQPSAPLDRAAALILVQCPYGCEMLIETVGYRNSLLSFYLYEPEQPIKARSFTNMGVNYPATPVPVIKAEKITAVDANAVIPAVIQEANRNGNGYIENKANKAMWVKWSDPASGTPLVAGDPFTQVPVNGNVDIPENHMGAISIIWATGVATTGKAYIHEFT